MKTIGLIGGMSWESTVTYYQIINETVRQALGGLHSAKCLLCSVDFHEIEAFQASGAWEQSGELLADAARTLARAGADCIVICTNTMHKVAGQVQAAVSIPLIPIPDATADTLTDAGIHTAALLGTKYTMTQDFYKARLTSRGIDVLTPEGRDIDTVNRIIYDELCLGVISSESKHEYLRIIDSLAARGAQGAILGCTEIGLLVGQADTGLALFDTARIHAQRAAYFALG